MAVQVQRPKMGNVYSLCDPPYVQTYNAKRGPGLSALRWSRIAASDGDFDLEDRQRISTEQVCRNRLNMDNAADPEGLVAQLLKAGLSGKVGLVGKSWNLGKSEHVRMWVRHEYKCGYCGENLLTDVPRMMSSQLDHLLPKWKYPDLYNVEDNWVLACFCCNQIKRHFDPWKSLTSSIDVPTRENIAFFRQVLIEISRIRLKPFREQQQEMHERVISILSKGE